VKLSCVAAARPQREVEGRTMEYTNLCVSVFE